MTKPTTPPHPVGVPGFNDVICSEAQSRAVMAAIARGLPAYAKRR